MRVVAALGGNALLRRGEPPTPSHQRTNIRDAARALAGIAMHGLVVTHGNGPQVGLLALRTGTGPDAEPLDLLDAETAGMIGYVIDQELGNLLPDRDIATLLTQVEVDIDDPAFAAPDKPIGPVYAAAEAERLKQMHGWAMARDGAQWRRVVPSPAPRRIVEAGTIARLIEAGVIVICAGGGGIPVALSPSGARFGVEAVVDKDATSALLATELEADGLLLLTDVDGIYTDWQTPLARRLREVSPDALSSWMFAAGSMAPKAAAACRFVADGGPFAAIGTLTDAAALLAGTAGTRVVPGDRTAVWYDD